MLPSADFESSRTNLPELSVAYFVVQKGLKTRHNLFYSLLVRSVP